MITGELGLGFFPIDIFDDPVCEGYFLFVRPLLCHSGTNSVFIHLIPLHDSLQSQRFWRNHQKCKIRLFVPSCLE